MISTHVLDQTQGQPAADLEVKLQYHENDQWIELKTERTDLDGRIKFQNEARPGVYRLIFELDPYFEKLKREHFFVRTPVVFKITDCKRNYHVPLLLNPFGFSTYRGS